MERKVFHGPLTLKTDGQPGEFTAVFATLEVKDHDGDVTVPGAFTNGEAVLLAHWNHNWDQLPVGRGVIQEDGKQAQVEGGFFMDTQTGREHHATVKGLAELQQWSYSFDILDHSYGEWKGEQVRFLKKLAVVEVAPVMRAAGIGTRTLEMKGVTEPVDGKPYPNEHACRIKDPADFEPGSFRRIERGEHGGAGPRDGKRLSIIVGRLRGKDSTTTQAYRYPIRDWTEAQAREHCKEEGGTFEAAKPADEKGADGAKLGARHTGKEYEKLQQIHDLIVELGAKCAEHDDTGGEGEGADEGEAHKGKPSGATPSTLAARVATELIESGYDEGARGGA